MKQTCKLCFLKNSLCLYNTYGVWAAATLLRVKFNNDERKYITLCSILSCEPDEIAQLTDAAYNLLCAGTPLAPSGSHMEDARWWVSVSNLDERKAYLAACFHSLPQNTQRDFIKYANSKVKQ